MSAPTGSEDSPATTGGALAGAPGLAAPDPASRGAEVVLHEERLLVSTRRVAVERVRISKRVVTQVRTVEVPVRVEQLVVEREPLDQREPAPSPGAERSGDLVIVLHEEVPEVTLRTVAVERVVVSTRRVAGEETLSVDLASEAAEVTTTGTTTTGPGTTGSRTGGAGAGS